MKKHYGIKTAISLLEEAKADIDLALEELSGGPEVENYTWRISKALNRCKTVKESADEAQANLAFHIGSL